VIQDEEIDIIYGQLEAEFGEVTYEAWLALLVSFLALRMQQLTGQTDITKDDSSSADQLREAFRGMAGEKVCYS
jgi:hypothetical protein